MSPVVLMLPGVAAAGRGTETSFEAELRDQGWTVNRDASHPAELGDIVVLDTKAKKVVRVVVRRCIQDLPVAEAALGSFSGHLEAEVNANAGFLAGLVGVRAEAASGHQIRFASVLAAEAARAELGQSSWTAACSAWLRSEGSRPLPGSHQLRMVAGHITARLDRETHASAGGGVGVADGGAQVGAGGRVEQGSTRSSEDEKVTIAYLFEPIQISTPPPVDAAPPELVPGWVGILPLSAGADAVPAFQLSSGASPSSVGARFTSSDTEVAGIDGEGRVIGVSPGYAVVRATIGDEVMELPVAVTKRVLDRDFTIGDGGTASVNLGPGQFEVIIDAVAADGRAYGVVVHQPARSCADTDTVRGNDGTVHRVLLCDFAGPEKLVIENPTTWGAGTAEVGTITADELPPPSASWTAYTTTPTPTDIAPFVGTWTAVRDGICWSVVIDERGRGTVTKDAAKGRVVLHRVNRVGDYIREAYAEVESSADASSLAAAPVMLGLVGNGMLMWKSAWGYALPFSDDSEGCRQQ